MRRRKAPAAPSRNLRRRKPADRALLLAQQRSSAFPGAQTHRVKLPGRRPGRFRLDRLHPAKQAAYGLKPFRRPLTLQQFHHQAAAIRQPLFRGAQSQPGQPQGRRLVRRPHTGYIGGHIGQYKVQRPRPPGGGQQRLHLLLHLVLAKAAWHNRNPRLCGEHRQGVHRYHPPSGHLARQITRPSPRGGAQLQHPSVRAHQPKPLIQLRQLEMRPGSRALPPRRPYKLVPPLPGQPSAAGAAAPRQRGPPPSPAQRSPCAPDNPSIPPGRRPTPAPKRRSAPAQTAYPTAPP